MPPAAQSKRNALKAATAAQKQAREALLKQRRIALQDAAVQNPLLTSANKHAANTTMQRLAKEVGADAAAGPGLVARLRGASHLVIVKYAEF